MLKTFYLFIALIIIGMIQSHRTPFWNDEIYTKKNIIKYSYTEIIEGNLPEGCNEPLFYIIQKADHDSRIFPIVCMALAVSIIFHMLLKYNGIKSAVLAVLLFMLPKITWQHFPECRPYSLIILLTTIEFALCKPTQIRRLAIVNIIMAFTDTICIVPIILSAFFIERKYWWIYILPTVIILSYLSVSVYANHMPLPGWSDRYFIYLLPIGILIFMIWYEKSI